jgi:hypothetical protein
VDLMLNSHARIQSDVTVQGGLNGRGTPRAPAFRVDGTSSFTRDPALFPILASSAHETHLGGSFTLDLRGNAGAFQVLYLSLRTGPTRTFPHTQGFGLLVLDRTQLFRIAGQVLPTSGTTTVNLRVPSTPALLGSTLFLQSAEAFGGAFAISNPALVTITR